MPNFLPNESRLSSGLRRFSKILVGATLFLIFAGSLVTSTGSGLAVPDWPLSYGMVFPPMVGGVFYEHGHRLIAATVGFLTVCLAIWIFLQENRRWMKRLGGVAILLVVMQGVLGGLTVLLQLPAAISVAHAITGQTFFCVTLFIAYGLSRERFVRETSHDIRDLSFARAILGLTVAVYVQLVLGALMRHWHAGLAVYDFPTMAGRWLPSVSEATLARINEWAMAHDQPLITAKHVIAHLAHRFWAFVVVGLAFRVNFKMIRSKVQEPLVRKNVFLLDAVVVLQFSLGVLTVWSGRMPYVASLHVVTGAALLGLCVLATLRAMPLKGSGGLSVPAEGVLRQSLC
jgi:cytochrome c oxidase assembly protein subunit 15